MIDSASNKISVGYHHESYGHHIFAANEIEFGEILSKEKCFHLEFIITTLIPMLGSNALKVTKLPFFVTRYR